MVRPTRRTGARALHDVARHAREPARDEDRARRGHTQAGRHVLQPARVLLELEKRNMHVPHTVEEDGASLQWPRRRHQLLAHLAQQSLSHLRLIR